jgi:hypothetical protein
MDIEIKFKTDEQRRIADLLWSCQSQAEVNVVLRAFGVQGYIVKEMIIAATFDDMADVELAQQVLKPYTLQGL